MKQQQESHTKQDTQVYRMPDDLKKRQIKFQLKQLPTEKYSFNSIEVSHEHVPGFLKSLFWQKTWNTPNKLKGFVDIFNMQCLVSWFATSFFQNFLQVGLE